MLSGINPPLQRIEIERLYLTQIALVPDQENDQKFRINPTRSNSYRTRQHDRALWEDVFPHFSAIIQADGTPWTHGNLFLLDRILNIPGTKDGTISGIANDLVHFINEISKNGIGYLDFSTRKLKLPTYQYHRLLSEAMDLGEGEASTAKKRLGSVRAFYRWLKKENIIDPSLRLWEETTFYQSFTDDRGQTYSKAATRTDLTFKVEKNEDPTDAYIEDGGKLRPLIRDEQKALVQALIHLKNPELLISFLIALTSGARIQTVFTLPKSTFTFERAANEGELVPVRIGKGTNIDNKNNKPMTLLIPKWVFLMACTYAKSERYVKRCHTAKTKHPLSEMDYLFITKSGSPYYTATKDTKIIESRTLPKGEAVRLFISRQLLPCLRQYHPKFRLSFHDLRATFGMNLLEDKLDQIKPTNGNYDLALRYVQQRMGHARLETTERYLKYRDKLKILTHTQSEFESYVQSLCTDPA